MLQNRPRGPTSDPSLRDVRSRLDTAGVVTRLPTRRRRYLSAWIARGAPVVAILIVLGFALEQLAPEDYKPSTITGGFIGHEEAMGLLTKLKATQATAAAQQQAIAQKEQEVEYFRARTERITEAYKTLYQRTNIMAQAIAGAQQQYLAARQQLIQESQGAKTGMAQLADIAAVFGVVTGDRKLASSAQEAGQALRYSALKELDDAMRQGMAQASANINDWQKGLPDIAHVELDDDRTTPLTPTVRTPAPPAPGRYIAQPTHPTSR